MAEWALGDPIGEFGGSDATERGKALEPQARRYYAFQRDLQPRTVGFVYRDEDRMVGASPDALVDPDGDLELKCPEAHTHILALARGGPHRSHFPQLQGRLWVTGRRWIDFLSYFPGLPPVLVRVAPDPAMQAAYDRHLPTFIAEVLEGRERLRDQGVTPWFETAPGADIGIPTSAEPDGIEELIGA